MAELSKWARLFTDNRTINLPSRYKSAAIQLSLYSRFLNSIFRNKCGTKIGFLVFKAAPILSIIINFSYFNAALKADFRVSVPASKIRRF